MIWKGSDACDGQVGLAVAVKVAHRERRSARTRRECGRCGECAIAVSQYDGKGVTHEIKGCQVDLAVAIEVRSDELRCSDLWLIGRGSECAIAVAQQDGGGAVRRTDGQIEL